MGTSNSSIDMLNGSLLDKIVKFALPLAISSVMQQFFNSVDMAVVGHFSGKEALAAVGSNSAVINLVVSLFVGLSVGANVIVANRIGENNNLGIKHAISTIACVSLVSGFVLLIVGLSLARPILEFIDTPLNVIDLSTIYLKTYFCGIPFIMIFNFGSAILRAKGDTKRPLYCLLIAGVVNVILNIIFVVGFDLDVFGVGLATSISNAISAAIIVWLLCHEPFPFRLNLSRITDVYQSQLTKMIAIGLPAGIQGMVFAISNVTIQSAINGFGSEAMSGSAAALNYEHFCYYIIAAFASAAVTFIGQNYAAGNMKRCRKILFHTMWLSLVCCGFFNLLFTWNETFFVNIFNTDPQVHKFAYMRMEWVLLFQFIASSYEVTGGALRGYGYSSIPAALTIVGTCALRLWWVAVIVPQHHLFEWLMVVYPISWVVTGFLVLVAYYFVGRKEKIFS